MTFTIVTPSLNQRSYLARNTASVRDQGGIDCEHVVQDAGSTDGTVAWLGEQEGLNWRSESDEGMYDAINRGIERGRGEILAWLNCDEQYLPGALERVAAYFEAHPEVDLVFGHTVIVGEEGDYLCHRKAVVPTLNTLRLAILPVHSSSMFFRRSVVEDGLLFDKRWRDLGDWAWVLKAKERGVSMGLIDEFLSSFTDTGENMNLGANALREKEEARAMTPSYLRLGRPLFRAADYGRKIRSGYYRQKPFHYEVYPPGETLERRRYEVASPTFYWKGRMLSR